jgi:predicted RecB family endonuclease
MCFDDGATELAKELGIGVLKLKGDAVEVSDADLKVY